MVPNSPARLTGLLAAAQVSGLGPPASAEAPLRSARPDRGVPPRSPRAHLARRERPRGSRLGACRRDLGSLRDDWPRLGRGGIRVGWRLIAQSEMAWQATAGGLAMVVSGDRRARLGSRVLVFRRCRGTAVRPGDPPACAGCQRWLRWRAGAGLRMTQFAALGERSARQGGSARGIPRNRAARGRPDARLRGGPGPPAGRRGRSSGPGRTWAPARRISRRCASAGRAGGHNARRGGVPFDDLLTGTASRCRPDGA